MFLEFRVLRYFPVYIFLQMNSEISGSYLLDNFLCKFSIVFQLTIFTTKNFWFYELDDYTLLQVATNSQSVELEILSNLTSLNQQEVEHQFINETEGIELPPDSTSLEGNSFPDVLDPPSEPSEVLNRTEIEESTVVEGSGGSKEGEELESISALTIEPESEVEPDFALDVEGSGVTESITPSTPAPEDAGTASEGSMESVFEEPGELGIEVSTETGLEGSMETGLEGSMESVFEEPGELGIEVSTETGFEGSMETGLEGSMETGLKESYESIESLTSNKPTSEGFTLDPTSSPETSQHNDSDPMSEGFTLYEPEASPEPNSELEKSPLPQPQSSIEPLVENTNSSLDPKEARSLEVSSEEIPSSNSPLPIGDTSCYFKYNL